MTKRGVRRTKHAKTTSPVEVFILGGGKVGRALYAKARAAGLKVRLHPARKGPPRRAIAERLVIFTVRDGDLARWAAELAPRVRKDAVCVHAAGSLRADALEAIRSACAGIAQMHPMISFASLTFFPTLERGNLHVQGDRAAERLATAFGKSLGMTVRTIEGLDPVGYHAAAGLLANGAAALAATASRLLQLAGVSQAEAPKILGPLLRSVAENVEHLGFPAALTGPVRRGDPRAVERHLNLLRDRLPEAVPQYLAAVAAQVPMARALGEAPEANFDAIEALLMTLPRRRR
jgi:predicted short-subunit dehydrogenase-like oxidoreductase (DUF2520 family)